MLEVELTEDLGYARYDPEGRNSGNSRNGHDSRQMRSSAGDIEIRVPRDRNSIFKALRYPPYSSEPEIHPLERSQSVYS